MKPIRFGLIGAGRMGKRWADVLSKSKNSLLAAIETRNFETLLSNKEIDAVVIAIPHAYLSPITRKALFAGKHVLAEKPGAIRSIDIKKNITLARKKSLTYMVGYNHRFHDGFIKARKLYERGMIGKIIFIRARYGFGGRVGYDQEWRLNKKISGGGHLLDQGVHMIDLAGSFIGKIESVQGIISDTFWKQGVEDNAFVLMQGRNKATASIHVSLTQWKPIHNFEMYGTKGYLSIEGLGKKYGDGEKLIVGKRSDDFISVKEETISCNANADDSLMLELMEFLSAIKQDRPTIPSPWDAYETLRVVEKVYEK